LELFVEQDVIRIDAQRVALVGFTISYTDAQLKVLQAVEEIYKSGGYAVPNLDDVQSQFASSREVFKQVLQSLVDNRVLICISPQIFLHRDSFNGAIQTMQEIQAENGLIALGEFRDRLATSRKYAYAFLEYCDAKNITQKMGDLRKLTGRMPV
ncbi:MAG: SelB C-terminal domain-containing protein, partial [Eubacteriales bacterium]